MAGENETPWFKDVAGFDTDVVGVMTAKGWDKLTPQEASLQAVNAYRAAEKLIGAPADEILRLPKDPASPDWARVHTRMGKPEKVEGYDLSTVKFSDGKDLDEGFVKSMRDLAFKGNLPAKAAADITSGVVKLLEDRDNGSKAETATKLIAQKQALGALWKVAPDALDKSPQMNLARNAMKALGIDDETVVGVNALESVVGYDKTLELFRMIGSRMREDNYISPTPGSGNDNIMTPATAQVRKDELMKDADWRAKWFAGDNQARKEIQDLDRVISSNIKPLVMA